MALPDFLIAGVPKAGTTALHAALVRHPELFLPDGQGAQVLPHRRPAAGHRRPRRRADLPGARLAAAPTTRRSSTRRRRARCAARPPRSTCTTWPRTSGSTALVPDAKLILLLRDPVDRAHSNWTHLWNAGLEPEADFLTACAAEPARRRRRLGRLLALRRPRAGTASRSQHLLQVLPARAGAAAALPRPEGRAGRHARPGLRVPRRAHRRARPRVPRENVNRHVVEDNAGQPGAARPAARPAAGSGTGSRCRCGWPPAARCSPCCTARRGTPAGDHAGGAGRAAAALRRRHRAAGGRHRRARTTTGCPSTDTPRP